MMEAINNLTQNETEEKTKCEGMWDDWSICNIENERNCGYGTMNRLFYHLGMYDDIKCDFADKHM